MTTLNPSAQQKIASLQHQAVSLLLYQNVLHNEVGQAFLNLLDQLNQPEPKSLECLKAYGHWFRTLADVQKSWSDYLLAQIVRDHNPFTSKVQHLALAKIPSPLIAAARQDLQTLQTLCQGEPPVVEQIGLWVQWVANLPEPPVSWVMDSSAHPLLGKTKNWADALPELIRYYQSHGTGIFGEYRALRWQSGELKGISYPDRIQLKELVGYEEQKQALLQNTEALLAGSPTLHVLLYGSRGSGKSSLIKGLLHQYHSLRLIEVTKSDLKDLPNIVERLRDLPQKFIIFVDDLSFEEDNDAFKSLKVVLEGNLTARPDNVIVYATSNRRHLIREFFGDRPRPQDAEEIHYWDTVQEKLSFSDRFGLTLTFEPADQRTYLHMVKHLATLNQVSLTGAELEYQALQWATRHNGRSGRTARQFIDFIKSQGNSTSN
ncbi:MAG: ATP-binding protein [Roseofilum sp. SID1]|uniref:ATP-binding protein n=1 Tax=Roseofilum sp. SID1 TaxID=2821497 RepID=UPI001B023330|nr:ATP-binding protein [Roseofilum sp. SID1]MBP0038412.1 ATP-binding protein [Roseofilum sp. SID1]